jgi:hypothetical protein
MTHLGSCAVFPHQVKAKKTNSTKLETPDCNCFVIFLLGVSKMIAGGVLEQIFNAILYLKSLP